MLRSMVSLAALRKRKKQYSQPHNALFITAQMEIKG